MAATLATLRTSIADKLRLADSLAKVSESDPRVTMSRQTLEDRLFVGESVHGWFIETINPSVEPRPGDSDSTVQAFVLGMRSVSDGIQAALEDAAQLVCRHFRDIPECRSAIVAGQRVTLLAGRTWVYEITVSALFYALVSTS